MDGFGLPRLTSTKSPASVSRGPEGGRSSPAAAPPGSASAAGPGKLRDNGDRHALNLKVGDEVLYGKYSGSEVEVEGRELKILRETDVLAKIVK